MPARDTRSALEVVHSIFGNIQEIARAEVHLVKTDIAEGVTEIKKPAAALAAGLMLAAYAAGLLLVALVSALTLVMEMWAATLLVGTVTATVSALLVVRGGNGVRRSSATSERTVASPKESASWATHQNR